MYVFSFEQDLPDRIRDGMKIWFQHIPLLCDDKQKIVADGYPNLREDRVHCGAIEGFDVKMLLYPFEKQFDLPSFPIQFSDRQGHQSKVVCQESIDVIATKVLINNEPNGVRVLLGRNRINQSNRFVRNKARIRVNFPALQNFVSHVVLCPGNEVGVVEVKVSVERFKFYISLVHQIVSVGFNGYLVHNFRIMDKPISEIDKCWDRSPKIQQGVHLESPFAMMEFGPRAEFEAQLNSAAVKGINHLIKVYSKFLASIKVFGFTHQNLGKVLIDSPILLFIRFRKCGSGHCFETGPVQILGTKVKSGFNISQTGAVCKLSEAHHHELITAFELNGMSVALITVDTLPKLIFIDKRHDLRENCFSCIHGLRGAA